jgi:hypothetical protein
MSEMLKFEMFTTLRAQMKQFRPYEVPPRGI